MKREKEGSNPNRLINEKSPYLLQHAYDPIDWYPWSDEAFAKAEMESKPIFLSIGYSTCHWCHVMQRESFKDKEVAEILNNYYISIKVDREERPDIDEIYMTACQIASSSCGWPLTVVMTPKKEPFFIGTYIPKESRFGLIGLKELLIKIHNMWVNDREKILETSRSFTNILKDVFSTVLVSEPSEELIEKTYSSLVNLFDNDYGGFGGAPKFPSPTNLLFLLRYWFRKKDEMALEMVEKTLNNMRLGGIYDQIGYGFHRYSTDKMWKLPHFEKMLYDQAMITLAYIESYLATGNSFYKEVVEETFDFVLRELYSPYGVFYSALDAESEDEEGKFYTWSMDELRDVADEGLLGFITKVFNVKEKGNYIDEGRREYTGRNVFYINKPLDDLAIELNLSKDQLLEKIKKIREKLFQAREKRVRPKRDEKVLTDWNSLMIVSFAKAGKAFNCDKYVNVAKKTVDFILKNVVKNSILYHSFVDGDIGVRGFLDDYSFFIWALIETYEATMDIHYLREAFRFAKQAISLFWNEDDKLFDFTSKDAETAFVKPRKIFDSSYPSGNSIMLLNLLKLWKISSDESFLDKAEKLLRSLHGSAERYPLAHISFLIALDFYFSSKEVVIVGPRERVDTVEMIKVLHSIYCPNKIVLYKDPNVSEISELANFTKNYRMINGKCTAYVCRNRVCNLPTTDLTEFRKQFTG